MGRERREDSLKVTYPQSSPFFNPGTFRISRGGSRFEYVTCGADCSDCNRRASTNSCHSVSPHYSERGAHL